MAGSRHLRPPSITRVLLSFLFSTLFIFSLFSFFSNNDNNNKSKHFSKSKEISSDELSLLRRQASDHLALSSAFASFSRKQKLSHHRLLSSFLTLSNSLSNIPQKVKTESLDEDSMKSTEKEAKDKIKLLRQLVAESKEAFDTQLKIQKLKDTVFAAGEQLNRARRASAASSSIAAGSTPKSLHCLSMRLLEHLISHPEIAKRSKHYGARKLFDQGLKHYALFSDNVIAVSVVVNSAAKNSMEPGKMVFHVVTNQMYLNVMRAWFALRPPPAGVRISIRSVEEFKFFNSSGSKMDIKYLRFYLPEIFPELKKIVLLEDDVVVQRDLEGLWWTDLDRMVNGAVETCFGGFRRYARYLNFSHPLVKEKFDPWACAWEFGLNVFDLDGWRRQQLTDEFRYYMEKNKDGTLWNSESVLPAGLMTFYTNTKPLDKSWHVMGLGYNPGVSPDEIQNADVIHFNGNMKPWLDVALNQYKHLWTKYVDTDMEFLQLCNFGV